jgi:hypothetical protein
MVYRWFTRPESRALYPEEDDDHHGRVFVAQLRETYTREGPRSRAAELLAALTQESDEFAALWTAHDIGVGYDELERIRHPHAGVLELHCQTLLDPAVSQVMLVFTAVPGSESHKRLELLTVLGEPRHDV